VGVLGTLNPYWSCSCITPIYEFIAVTENLPLIRTAARLPVCVRMKCFRKVLHPGTMMSNLSFTYTLTNLLGEFNTLKQTAASPPGTWREARSAVKMLSWTTWDTVDQTAEPSPQLTNLNSVVDLESYSDGFFYVLYRLRFYDASNFVKQTNSSFSDQGQYPRLTFPSKSSLWSV